MAWDPLLRASLRLPLPGMGLPGLEELSIPPISDKDRRMGCTPLSSSSPMGPFKYYVIKGVGGVSQMIML